MLSHFLASDESSTVKQAVTSIGRQPSSDVYVFSPAVQVSNDGKVCSPGDQKYVWVDDILQYTSVLPTSALLPSLPTCQEPLKVLLKGLKTLTQRNFVSSVFVLGKYILYAQCYICLYAIHACMVK